MVNGLILDAATEACSVAVVWQGKVAGQFEICPQQHSQKILPMVDAQLQQAGCALGDVDYIAFGQGPGSFTGVRIGVAVAQGLGFASGKPLIGVSTLQTMAQQALSEAPSTQFIFSAIDARMGEVYYCAYQVVDGVAQPLFEERVDKPENLRLAELSGLVQQTWTTVGTGFTSYPNLLTAHLVQAVQITTAISLPNAEFMAPLAALAWQQGRAVEASQAQAVYVRDTVTWQKLPGR